MFKKEFNEKIAFLQRQILKLDIKLTEFEDKFEYLENLIEKLEQKQTIIIEKDKGSQNPWDTGFWC